MPSTEGMSQDTNDRFLIIVTILTLLISFMTKLELPLTTEEEKWLSAWVTMQAYASPAEGVREVLKVCGAIPRGSEYWKDRFTFAE